MRVARSLHRTRCWPLSGRVCSLGRRMGLMRNQRAGKFQGKWKNSTCSASPERRETGPRAGEAQRCTPSFWGAATCPSTLPAKQ